MGFSFRKSIRLGKGFRLNLSKGGIGLGGGIRGMSGSIGPRGARLSGGKGGLRFEKRVSLTSARRRDGVTPQTELEFDDAPVDTQLQPEQVRHWIQTFFFGLALALGFYLFGHPWIAGACAFGAIGALKNAIFGE